jgi:hypothetical protein
MLMASPDGKAWTVTPEIGGFRDSSVIEIRDVGDRLVAVGYRGMHVPTSPQAWTSVDAHTWEAADVQTDEAAMYTLRRVRSW